MKTQQMGGARVGTGADAVVDGLLAAASASDRSHARRVVLFLRLLIADRSRVARGESFTSQAVPRASAELERLRVSEAVRVLMNLVDHCLGTRTSRAGAPPIRSAAESWERLAHLRCWNPGLPRGPLPDENSLAVAKRLVASLQSLARSRPDLRGRVRAWSARLGRAQQREARRECLPVARLSELDPRSDWTERSIEHWRGAGLCAGRVLEVSGPADPEIGPVLSVLGQWGEPAERRIPLSVLRAAAHGEPLDPDANPDGEGARSGAEATEVLAIGCAGQVHGLLVLASQCGGLDQASSSGGVDARFLHWAAAEGVGLRAAQFRAWHARTFGSDPWFEPTAEVWTRVLRVGIDAARSGARVQVHGPDPAVRQVARRWIGFERLSGAPVDSAPASTGPVSAVSLHLPGLAARRREILPLSRHFLRAIEGTERLGAGRAGSVRLTEEARALLWRQDWPGETRQLARLLLRAMREARARPGERGTRASGVLFLDPRRLQLAARRLGIRLTARLAPRSATREDLSAALDETRRRNGSVNQARAARYLGWDPFTFAKRARAAGVIGPPRECVGGNRRARGAREGDA